MITKINGNNNHELNMQFLVYCMFVNSGSVGSSKGAGVVRITRPFTSEDLVDDRERFINNQKSKYQ